MSKLGSWIEKRLPIASFLSKNLKEYYVHHSLNFWYAMGAIALVMLAVQVLSGIFLLMYYVPTTEKAFSSIQYMMREIPYGWLIRYLHVVGASFFFIAIYLHMFRAFLYGSYKNPREFLWMTGVIIYIIMIAIAYTGYVLPWGQMSYWATRVIISFLTVIPYVGESLAQWLQGDFMVSSVTLSRFYAFHIVAFPLVVFLFIGIHIVALHVVGSNNPEGIDINAHKKPPKHLRKKVIPFHPYIVVKDLFVVFVAIAIFLWIIFYAPTFYGFFLEHINQVPANPLVTPSHIHPVWYLSPFYAILRAIPDKLLGVIFMFLSLIILFFMPWLDRSPVKSMRYKGIYSRASLCIFILSIIMLGYYGMVPATDSRLLWTRIFTVLYFGHFILMPIYTRIETCKKPPELN
ncbi:MAG: cytochrome bc complex cytochrome b subunit [Pseudomonadota bacterium]|nr:cytochrome bc complex cytochrome b subunit [Pseudomonadota bacterium]